MWFCGQTERHSALNIHFRLWVVPLSFFLLIKVFNISQTRTFYDKISLRHIRNILVFTDKQRDKHKNSKKVVQNTPQTNTDVVYEFQLNRFSSLEKRNFLWFCGQTERHSALNIHFRLWVVQLSFFYSLRSLIWAKHELSMTKLVSPI